MRVYLMVCCLISYTVNGQVEYSVPEETERGAPVGNLAKDLGIDAATLPSRKSRMITSSSKQYFSLNASTGALSVNEPIDREQICALKPTCSLNYELVLENPLELYKMQFKILDVNDNAPVFPLEEYHLNVAEFLSQGARFTLPNAQDPDEGINGVQSYTLSPNEHFRLEMQTRGDGSKYPELVLEKPLDREEKAMHRLVITAKDGGIPQRSGEAQVVVTVLDTNDNAPAFEHSVYRASILENSPNGTLVTHVHATDLDEGQNGEVQYSFSNSTPAELQKMFRINPQTGEIKVSGVLDGQKPLLEMFIEARDKGVFGMSSVAKLLVEITDVNNNAPEITVTSLSSPIPEDSSLGTVIALLSITDKDPGENGKVICQVPTNIPFQLKSSFDSYYSLVTSGLLDRERVSEYNISITASDLGSPPIATQKILQVQIADVNDNPPKFLNQMREVSVTENNRPGVSLFRVSASDPDLGENGRVSYLLRDIDIQGSSLSSYLAIDADSGVIYAKGTFDFEQLQSFHFQVEAKDNGSPALAAAFIVSITILDQNDNAPVILYPGTRNGSVAVEIVPRLADADYLVTKVVAHDPDSGQNAWLSYHLLQSSDASLFRVSPNVGELRTSRSMRSSDPIKHKVVVLVKDSGEPPLSSSVTLGILLADSLPQALPDFDDSLDARGQQLSPLNFYLIISLACLSFVFLGFLLFLLAIRLFHCRTSPSHGSCCCCCCCPTDDYEKYRYNVRMLPSSHFTPEMVEVAGMGKLTHTYLYRAALGVGPSNNNLMPNGDAGNLSKGAGLLQVPASCIQVQKVKSDHFNAILVQQQPPRQPPGKEEEEKENSRAVAQGEALVAAGPELAAEKHEVARCAAGRRPHSGGGARRRWRRWALPAAPDSRSHDPPAAAASAGRLRRVCRRRWGRCFGVSLSRSLSSAMTPPGLRCCRGAETLGLLLLPLLLRLGPVGGQLRYAVAEELQRGAVVGNVANDLTLEPQRLESRAARLTSGSGKQYMALDLGRGLLLVKERMDREALCELSPFCFLSLELVIEQPVEVHQVEVEVLDINDNAPRFPRQEYRLKISESAVLGARFPIEGAQDPDVGSNSVQNYRLSPNEHFALDLRGFERGSKLLELVLLQPLDREQSALQRLVLTAVDGGNPAKSATAQISVLVLDTNDNPPEFDRGTYKATLLENSTPGTLVVKLNASDPDEGSNGDLLYSFSSYTPQKVRQLFSVDPVSGEVRINGTLDYEEASSYEIYVQATDKGSVPMAGHCKVLVSIVDANDNAPEVVLTSLYSPVPEDAHPETVVALMSVTDQDSGQNRQVNLSIPTNLPFKLNSFKNSYTMVTQGPLDRERASTYNVTVTATDAGTPPLSSHKVIQVDISDINDNPPRFEEPTYFVYIPENNAPGVSLCTAKAIDIDADENAYVSYSLLNGAIQGLPVTSYVSIKSDTGDIYAVVSFDYEKLREFQVVVQAQDSGVPVLSSTVTVHIYVVDQNDHAPQILYPTPGNASAAMEMIPRSASAGYLVTKVIAIDADSGQNAWLFFHLAQTSAPDIFRVEVHSGEIRTTRKLGEDSGTTFNLTVVVRDNGEPALSSSVSIMIEVVDRVSKIVPDTRRHIKSSRNYSEITLYLIIALSSVSFIFLLTIVVLTVIKCYRYSAPCDSSCCGGFCGTRRERCPVEMYKQQANNNLDARMSHGLKVQPHFIEVRGNGSLSKTYCYKACLTAGSGSDTFMFYNTGAPTGITPQAMMAERHLTGQSGQSSQNLIILKSEPITPNEPKPPNPDWRYSASLRAGMQGAVHMEEAGGLRGGPGGPEQQWPTVSSATTEPEAGEVSPPVGAGVNSNSWTFKYGPGNSKQPGPGELPDKFIIPGSPAIISIRQDPPNSQTDKSDFITFGKKEETKKKKKKKKGNKAQEKKEKGNSTTDNSDQ